MVDEREMDVVPAQLYLCAFAAVNHELLVANLDYLCAGIVSCGWQCRTATKYMYLEILHSNRKFSHSACKKQVPCGGVEIKKVKAVN